MLTFVDYRHVLAVMIIPWQTCMLTFAQLAKRKPFLNTSNESTVSAGDEPIQAVSERCSR